MKYATVEDIIASFPQPLSPTVQGEPGYQTIHANRKLLQANARAIDTHLGGGFSGHLNIIVSEAAYTIVAPLSNNGPVLWGNQEAPGRAPSVIESGTAAQLTATRHTWEEAVLTFRTYNSVQPALKKKIITVFETVYLDILNKDMVGFDNINAREMLEHLFITYGSTILSKCAMHGIPSNQLRPCSSRSKIVLTFLRQEE
jgi:hypothetical protein